MFAIHRPQNILGLILLSLSFLTYADISGQKIAECTMSNFVTSERFGAEGDAQNQSKFKATALQWLRYGEGKFGEDSFSKLIKPVGPRMLKESNDKLNSINATCESLRTDSIGAEAQPERTYCAMSSVGTVGCGLTAAQCQKVISGLAGMVCR